MVIILDQELYDAVKAHANKVYDKPSAYKSMYIQKLYKQLNGKYKDDGSERKLSRWMSERWTDAGDKKDGYPVLRPTVRISQDTPLTVDEIDKQDLQKQIKLKQIIKGKKNLPKFKPKLLL
jgi:hypothetical protein